MTLRASSVKKSSAARLFGLTVKKNFGITVLVSIFMLLICPGYVLIDINNYFSYGTRTYEFDNTLFGLSMVITVLTCAVAVMNCFLNFAFMYSKKSGDVYFALPLTRKGLLFSRLFASVLPVLLPVVLCYGSMGLILLLDNVSGSLARIIFAMLFNILLLILCCAVTMVFIVCAGSVTDLLISYFGINIGLLVAALIFSALCSEHLVGYSYYNEESVMFSASPIIYGFVAMAWFIDSGFLFNGQLIWSVVRIAVTIVASVILSVVLFRKRKSEKCTCAYAYRGMYYICGLVVGFVSTFLMGMLFGGGYDGLFFWVFGLAGAVLGTVTFGLITDRGFKTVKKSLIVGAGSYAVMVAIVVILQTGGLGYSQRIPSAEDIKSVTVSFGNLETEFTNPEIVLQLHKKAIVSDKGSNGIVAVSVPYEITETTDYRKYDSTNVRLSYKLKNGLEMHRSFNVSTVDCENELMAVYKSNENIEEVMTTVKSFTDDINFYGHLYNDKEGYINTFITKDEALAITNAYVKELKTADADILYSEVKFGLFYIEGTTLVKHGWDSVDLHLTEDFTETFKVIEDLNLFERSEKQEK